MGGRLKMLLASNRNWWDGSSPVGGSVNEIDQFLDLLCFCYDGSDVMSHFKLVGVDMMGYKL